MNKWILTHVFLTSNGSKWTTIYNPIMDGDIEYFIFHPNCIVLDL